MRRSSNSHRQPPLRTEQPRTHPQTAKRGTLELPAGGIVKRYYSDLKHHSQGTGIIRNKGVKQATDDALLKMMVDAEMVVKPVRSHPATRDASKIND